MTIEEYVESTPRISIDGGITLGSKKSTMFLVDLKSGKIISSHWSTNDQKSADFLGRQDQLALFDPHSQVLAQSKPGNISPVLITRTDYTINHFFNSSEPLWGMTISVIEAAACQILKDDLSMFSRIELGSKYDGVMKQCNKIPVHRIHGIDPLKNGLVSSNLISLPETPRAALVAASPGGNHRVNGFSDSQNMGQLPSADQPSKVLNETQPFGSTSENPHEGNNSNGGSLSVGSHVLQRFYGWLFVLLFFPFFLLYYVKVNYQAKSGKQSSKPQTQPASASKKKKTRKSGNSNGSNPSEKDDMSQGNFELMNFSKLDENSEGRRIGKLFLSNNEIAKGSNGTIVLEGVFDGRPVAVKRLVRAHHDVAFKEIENLIASDQHPNIVRWFGVEYDSDFVYIALERCICSLNDLIFLCPDESAPTSPYQTLLQTQKTECSPNLKRTTEDVELWKPDGCPTPQLLKIMRFINFLSLVLSSLLGLHSIDINVQGCCIWVGPFARVGNHS